MDSHLCDNMSVDCEELSQPNVVGAPRGDSSSSKRERVVIQISESSASSPTKVRRRDMHIVEKAEVTSRLRRGELNNNFPQPSVSKQNIQNFQLTPAAAEQNRAVSYQPPVSACRATYSAAPNRLSAGCSILAADSTPVIPLLCISELSEISPRFALEGRVLNNYGTYKIRIEDTKFARFFKVDLVDARNSDTVTVVVSESLINQFANKLSVGCYVRIEGASVRRRNKADGGSSSLSLHVDSTTTISNAAPFTVSLSFYPEKRVRIFLDEAHELYTRGSRSYLSTLAFVVIKSDNLETKAGGTRGELVVADGPSAADRATITFVNDRKDEHAKIVKDMEAGRTVMFVARNIGAFMSRENTLSVLDLTILMSVKSPRLRAELMSAYKSQMEELGYGKEVTGTLQFENINDALLENVCYACKSGRVQKTSIGAFCVDCGKNTRLYEIPHLHCRITVSKEISLSTQLVGSIVDRVLHLDKPFRAIYLQNTVIAREILVSTTRRGVFKLNMSGYIVDFTEGSGNT